MALTEIEYGSIASSALLNGNFQYLQEKITELAALIKTETSSFSSSVVTLNKSVNELLQCSDSFIPTGTIIGYQSEAVPTGFLICDGSELKIEEFEDLYKVIGTTYGQTDSTTFCIPNLQNRVMWGKDSSKSVGQTLVAGLPNITGFLRATDSVASGAFRSSLGTRRPGGSGVGDYQGSYWFDASRCNSIYGKSSTVQPPAMVTNFLIKY